MEDMVRKAIQFILFLVNAIKDMVATLSGKGPKTDDAETTTEPVSE